MSQRGARVFVRRSMLGALAFATLVSACGSDSADAGGDTQEQDATPRPRTDRTLADVGAEPGDPPTSPPVGSDGGPEPTDDAAPTPTDDAGPPPGGDAALVADQGPPPPEPDAEVPSICGGHTLVDLGAALVDGSVLSTTVGAPAHLAASCGGGAGGEVVFFYDVEAPLDSLTFSTVSPDTTAPTVLYLRRDCDVPDDLVCNRGSGAQPGTAARIAPVEPGRIYVIVDQGARDGGGPFRLSVEAEAASACRNSVDDDLDGRLDLADSGCESGDDDDEADPARPPECADGLDNDEDMRTDYPADPECLAAGIDREAPLCQLDVPLTDLGEAGGRFEVRMDSTLPSLIEPTCGFGTTSEVVYQLRITRPVRVQTTVGADFFGRQGGPFAIYLREVCDAGPDVACVTGGFNGLLDVPMLDRGIYFLVVDLTPEVQDFGVPQFNATIDIRVTPLRPGCADELDNDFDGEVDAADLGCVSPVDDEEGDDPVLRPFCADGLDNDADGNTDFPVDDGCTGLGDPCEEPGWDNCGGVCLDIAVDANNCGACGNRCEPGVECINSYCGGAVAILPLDGFGHHGSCDAWNGCVDAQGCADAACRLEGFGRAVEFDEGSCQAMPAMGMRCNLFFDVNTGQFDPDYRGCELPVAFNIRCLP